MCAVPWRRSTAMRIHQDDTRGDDDARVTAIVMGAHSLLSGNGASSVRLTCAHQMFDNVLYHI